MRRPAWPGANLRRNPSQTAAAASRYSETISTRRGEGRQMATATVVKGLEGVVAANSGICWIDGYAGVLAYRGIDIHELAEKSTFEETTCLLWHGRLPTASELDAFKKKLADSRHLPPDILKLLQEFPKTATPMEVLRTAVSALSFYDKDEKAV